VSQVAKQQEAVMSLQFQLQLAWSQISLFDANLSDPFNDWTEQHLLQGFTWRPGSISFKLPVREGRVEVSVDLVDRIQVECDARWAIVVPFTTFAGLVEVSTIESSELLEVPAGRFAVIYQTGVRDRQAWAHFGFLASPLVPVEPTILRGDHEVYARNGFLMEAEPAA
jgi:hypothetical protein